MEHQSIDAHLLIMGEKPKNFKNFTFKKITKEDLKSVLKIRNQEEVRKTSINNKIICI